MKKMNMVPGVRAKQNLYYLPVTNILADSDAASMTKKKGSKPR
jgi:hypothetical protein